MKRELVVLSLVVAVFVAAGFGESDNEFDNKNETTTHSHTSSEPPTSTKSSATSSRPSTSAATAITGHGETTAFPSPTTPKPLGVYAVKDSKGSYCIIIDANISIAVNYVSAANKTESCNVYVPPANNVTIAGSCGEHKANEQWIAIHFNGDWNLTFRFERLNSKYFLSNLSLEWNLDTSCAKHPERGQLEINTHLFETSTGYLCMARKSLYTNASVVNDIGGIYTEKLKLEAFQNKTSPSFSDKLERCSEDNISNLVPIIVGACLGGLIIIVLIAYLIGRKRSRRGYESV